MRARWQAATLVCAWLLAGAPARAQSAAAAYDFVLAQLLAAEGEYAEALEAFARAAQAAPADPYVRLEYAELLYRTGRLDQAVEAARAARALAPDDREVLRVLARIEMTRSDRDESAADAAIEAWEALRRSEPGDIEALVSLGQLYLDSDRAEAATEALAEAARLRPGQPMIEALLARALAVSGRAADAERLQRELLAANPRNLGQRLELVDLLGRGGRLDEAIALLGAAPEDQQLTLDLQRRLAHLLYLSGDLAGARRAGERLIATHQEFAGARLLLGLIELADGRFTAAETWLAPLAAQALQSEQVADLYVRALEGAGRVDEALETLHRREAAAATAGRSAEALRARLERALVLARAGRWDELARLAEEMRGSADTGAREQGLLLLAEAMSERGRFDEALGLLEAADVSRPALLARRAEIALEAGRREAADRDLTLLRGVEDGDLEVVEVLHRRGEYERSLALLEARRGKDPGSIDVAFRLASAYERTGRIAEAVAELRELVHRAPQFAPALNYLGYLWIERSENLEEALGLVREAVRLDPDNGAYVDSLGWGYHKLGRGADAVALLERAARLLPTDATVLEHLGDALVAVGETRAARAAYRRAVAAGGADAASAAEKLARLGGES